MEKCDRCGEVEHDRRTLWMRCFYDMNELGLPFVVRSSGPATFYTLRVCKDCRADWMHAIKSWFASSKPQETGTGVYIRDLGMNREATPEEVQAMTNPIRINK